MRFRPTKSLRMLLFATMVFGASALPLRAQTDTGEMVITVVDAQTGKPVADARTILVGPETASSLTTAAGVIH
ncbi:MAG: hypothetical protein IAI50_11495, partial [Candidatus Eremiobacteraeota bacterium]|nr:hypothetical protein [Candidatus Eremiobacteraeota bacterium]